VGEQSIQQAKSICEETPKLAEQVASCAINLSAAYGELQEQRRNDAQRAKDAERPLARHQPV
jgi:hypothetical protein